MKFKKLIFFLLTIICFLLLGGTHVLSATNSNNATVYIDEDHFHVYNPFSLIRKDLTAIVAGYSDNAFVGYEPINIKDNAIHSFPLTQIDNFSLDHVNEVKVFFWNTANTYLPLCEQQSVFLNQVVDEVNYCVVTGLWYTTSGYIIDIVNSHGQELSFKMYDLQNIEDLAAHIGIPSHNGHYLYDNTDFSKNISKSVVKYKLQDYNEFVFVSGETPVNKDSSHILRYDSSKSALGEHCIDRSTKIINLEFFLEDFSSSVLTDIWEEMVYNAYVFGEPNGAPSFVVITDSEPALTPYCSMAMIDSFVGVTEFDDVLVREYIIRRSLEDESIYVKYDDALNLSEGDIILLTYSTMTGYYDNTNLCVVLSPEDTYEQMLEKVLTSNTTILDAFKNDVLNNNTVMPDYEDDSYVDVYMGIAYSGDYQSFSLIKNLSNGVGNVLDAENFYYYNNHWRNTGDFFTYDYSLIADKGYRVAVGRPEITTDEFNLIKTDDSTIDFNRALDNEIYPSIVLMRKEENMVTDVFFFTYSHDEAPYTETQARPGQALMTYNISTYKTTDITAESISYYISNSNRLRTLELCNPQIYINGYELKDTATSTAIEQANLFTGRNNISGFLRCIDIAKEGVLDNKYDSIEISYTESKIVHSTRTQNELNEILFTDDTKMSWNVSNSDIRLERNYNVVEFENIKAGDVLTVTMPPENTSVLGGNLENINSAEISINAPEKGIIREITQEYPLIVDTYYAEYEYYPNAFIEDTNYIIGNEYLFYIDAHGCIVHAELLTPRTSYGIVTGLCWSDELDTYQVTLITSDANTLTYEVQGPDVEELALTLGAQKNSTDKYEYSYNDFKSNVENSLVKYKIYGNAFVMTDSLPPVSNNEELEFRESTSKLGGYKLDEDTIIIDLSGYLENSGYPAKQKTINTLNDGFIYNVHIFDKNINGSFTFVIVTSNPDSIQSISPIGIVKKYIGETIYCTANSEFEAYEYTVIRDSEETTLFTTTDDGLLSEGDVIMYSLSTEGYVKSTEIIKLYCPEADYNTMIDRVLSANTSIFDAFKNDYLTSDTIDINGTETGGTRDDVKVYMGLVYKANINDLSIFTDLNDGVGAIADTKDFSISNANVTTYNYFIKANKGYRTEAAYMAVSPTLFNPLYDTDKNYVDFSKYATEQVEPTLAFVREIDNDVTDVVYYTFD